MTNDLSSTLDVTLNAICAMIVHPFEIAELDFSCDESLIDGLKRFCVKTRVHFDDSDNLTLQSYLKAHPYLVPNWRALSVVAKQMKNVPPAVLETTSAA